ncbi:MAG: 1-(5-phosphoribosyl)-5-amino-4-imidazole-carboxylate carboxylase [Nitrospinae bacterium CG11_big_fil_rev_8_21_14_0_20_45_15]|nr:MAG: 1-(5-phosphoribosyl)-5-amino-4-imidazole-carboxylate carboxylase [Nitrospinae bacterium CG11_big_fil_rev_8_21_14_0_20_45_15]
MSPDNLKEILQGIQAGKISPDEALEKLKTLPFENLGFAHLDHHRQLRTGIPEVIYCEGKSKEQLHTIIHKMSQAGATVLGTRLSPESYQAISDSLPENAVYDDLSRTLVINKNPESSYQGKICILTAGTSDIGVAEEAAITAEIYGSRVQRIFDVGVAGIHRLFNHIDEIRTARVLIVAAGMDGALASVVGGLVSCPVIALPTSVGYGTSFGGLSALLAMLNSCAPGIGVVNIDNGFGAACLAHRINIADPITKSQK